MKIGIAGSLESNDCLVTIKDSDVLSIKVQSIVDAFYHDQIVELIQTVLEDVNMAHVDVTVIDKGALNYTIKARLLTALHRMEASHA
jgi:citrate lyase subunit gamma (acyl carrier protein)